MFKQRNKNKKRNVTTNKQLIALLILTVTLVLLTLILTGGQAGLIALAVMTTLIVLILSVTGHPELLPDILKAILSEIRRAVTFRQS
jgi:hypothetical protein